MKQVLRVKTFTIINANDKKEWVEVEKAIESLEVHTINTILIPAVTQEIPITASVSGADVKTGIQVLHPAYLQVMVWHWVRG